MASRQQPHTVFPLRNSPHSAAANNAAMIAAITGPNWYSMNAKLLSSAGQSERTCPAILISWTR